MPADVTTAFTPSEAMEDPSSPDGLPSTGVDRDLEDLWEELNDELESRQKAIDRDERFSGDELEFAFQIAFAFPEEVDVEIKPFGRGKDLSEHVRGHFDHLLNEVSDYGALGSGASVDVGRLLKVCELIFIDDSMYRFSKLREFSPEKESLDTVGFISQSPENPDSFIEEWHQELEIVWNILTGGLDEGIRLDESIDRLYEERGEFIEHAKENNIYMPITTEVPDDMRSLERNIRRKIRRENVNPANIHKYCYQRERQIG